MASAATTDTLIARRYAEALFGLAEGHDADTVARDMARLRAMLAESADLRRVVSDPVLGQAARGRALAALAAAAGFDDLTRRFIGVVARNNRLGHLDGIAAAFLAEISRRSGLQAVEIVSARPLGEAQRAAMEQALNKVLAAKTTLTVRVDPALIGGMIIRAGSRLIDASVKSRLERLGRTLKTAA